MFLEDELKNYIKKNYSIHLHHLIRSPSLSTDCVERIVEKSQPITTHPMQCGLRQKRGIEILQDLQEPKPPIRGLGSRDLLAVKKSGPDLVLSEKAFTPNPVMLRKNLCPCFCVLIAIDILVSLFWYHWFSPSDENFKYIPPKSSIVSCHPNLSPHPVKIICFAFEFEGSYS